MRTGRHIGRFVAVVIVFFLGPAAALAQAPASSFDQIRTRLRVGDTVFVTDAAGREQKGTLEELSPSLLVLRSGGGLVEFPPDRVASVSWRRRDSLANGALIGLGTGALAGLAWAAAWCADQFCDASDYVGASAFAGVIAIGMGVGIDALIPGRRVLVYQRPPGAATLTFALSPIVSPRRQGLAVSVGF